MADSLRQLDSLDNESLLAVLLSGGTISSFFDQETTLASLRTDLENKIDDLNSLKTTLKTNETTAEAQKAQLAAYKQTLAEQQQGLAISKDSQTKLLTQTKNQESLYQSQIAEKQKEEAGFESDLLNFQSKLNLSLSASACRGRAGRFSLAVGTCVRRRMPSSGRARMDNVHYAILWQHPFSTANPQIYSATATAVSTLRRAPARLCWPRARVWCLARAIPTSPAREASFGKWIFIKHDNGLSYALWTLGKLCRSHRRHGNHRRGDRLLRHHRLCHRAAPPLWRIRLWRLRNCFVCRLRMPGQNLHHAGCPTSPPI